MGKLISRRIIACYVAYNAADVIEQSLNSVIDLVDFVVSVDGAYHGMPVADAFSVDGTQDIVKRIAGKRCRVIFPRQHLSEPQTRNLYARLVLDRFPDEWLFSIDSDEVVQNAQGDFEWLRTQEAQLYNIAHISRDDDQVYRRRLTANGRSMFHDRFYRGIPGLHYAETHGTLRDAKGDKIKPKYRNVYLKEARLHHLHSIRSGPKLDATGYYDVYQRWKYEEMRRPRISYLPYPLVKVAKRVMLRCKMDPNRVLFCAAIGNRYLLGYERRYDRRYTG